VSETGGCGQWQQTKTVSLEKGKGGVARKSAGAFPFGKKSGNK